MLNTLSLKQEIYRKSIHLSSLWMVAYIYFMDIIAVNYTFFCLSLILLSYELGRRYIPFIKTLNKQILGSILRDSEHNKNFTGAFYVVLSIFLASLLFDKQTLMISVSIMLISDGLAALIGKKWGRIKFMDKSLEGSLAFFISSFLITYLGTLNIITAIIVALITTLTELFSKRLRLDDNLTITLIAGFILKIA